MGRKTTVLIFRTKDNQNLTQDWDMVMKKKT